MPQDPRVTAYIAKAAPLAQPILERIRAQMHAIAPEIGEDIKWSMPFFVHNDQPLANMAAFKQHAAFGFWRREGAGPADENADAMGQFGRLTSVADVPDAAILAPIVHAAMALIDEGAKTRRAPRAPKVELAMPYDLAAALAAVPIAQANFDGFPPGAQREYLEWVIDAKQPATRARRIASTVEWAAEGKRRNWKYENC